MIRVVMQVRMYNCDIRSLSLEKNLAENPEIDLGAHVLSSGINNYLSNMVRVVVPYSKPFEDAIASHKYIHTQCSNWGGDPEGRNFLSYFYFL